MNKVFKIIALSLLSFVSFTGSIICGLYSGVYLKRESSEGVKYLIDNECEKQDCGNAIFASVSFDNTEENRNKIIDHKNKFNEVLNNQLSLAEFNCEINISNKLNISNINIVETEYYSTNYDSMHIYSHYTWYYYNEDINNVYISSTLEKKIRTELKISDIKGLDILINVNNIQKELKIGGAYYSNFYPTIKGLGSRGDGIVSSLGETIFIHPEIINEFNPSKAVAMFSLSSSNNGKKYIDLKKTCIANKFEFDFYKNPLENSTLINDIKTIENYFSSSKRTSVSIVLVFGVFATLFVFLFAFSLLLNIVDMKSLGHIRENIITFALLIFILLITFGSLLIFMKKSFLVSEIVKIPFLNVASIIFILISTLIAICFLSIRQRHVLSILLSEKEVNSEFDY